MLKIERYCLNDPTQMDMIIDGMRNPLNSWDKKDSGLNEEGGYWESFFEIGPNDHKLMKSLAKAGPSHRKYLRMMTIYMDVTAPLYWWKEFDTYKCGTVANSCSTMHKLCHKKFEIDDFSHEHLNKWSLESLHTTITNLNYNRNLYLAEKDSDRKKDAWWNIIQLLPSSYNQKRTIMLNYETLTNIYETRRHHKLDEWHVVCDWIETLPYSELITGKAE